jgi:hypothetical protein
MKRTSKTAIALAAAAAALFVTGCSTMCGDSQEALVKCAGSNACKGSSDCSTPDNACKGRNSCKGSGWSHVTKSECMSNGGTIVD